MVEGTTQVITGAVKLAYNRGQQHQTHQSLHTAEDFTTADIPWPTGKQPFCPHKIVIRLLTCCMKMVQQISYAQKVKELMEQQGVAATSSLKTLHPSIYQEDFPTGGGQLQQYTFLTSNASDDFHQIITSQNWLSHQNTQGFIVLGHNSLIT